MIGTYIPRYVVQVICSGAAHLFSSGLWNGVPQLVEAVLDVVPPLPLQSIVVCSSVGVLHHEEQGRHGDQTGDTYISV